MTSAGLESKTPLFYLPFSEFRRLHRRARRAQQLGHLEVVGLLVTADGKPNVLTLAFLDNCAAGAGHWELRRDEVARVRRELRVRGLRVRGLFHSHPVSEAILGVRDRRNTPTGWAHLVYDVCGLEPKLYKIRRRKGRRRVEQLALTVGRSRPSSPPVSSNV
jgi:proteasome lid subunit RPN8/RPN11